MKDNENMDSGRKPFLRQVAEHYFDCGSLERMMFIFPNRRSMTFFRKHIGDISRERNEPRLLPSLTSVSDFYSKASGLAAADRITLLLQLYGSYSKLNRKAESLDDFIYWGDVLLADFEDIDKYLVDAKMLFANITDLKTLTQDIQSYADQRQIDAIKKLAGHFENWNRETASEKDARKSFLSIWELLQPLYLDFRENLAAKGLAYSGMIYRDIARRAAEGDIAEMLREVFPATDKFVFVGLNILSRAEEVTMKKMHSAGLAEFCWDFCGDIVTDSRNTLFRFMRQNVETFPNAFTVTAPKGSKPAVHSVSVPSATGQTKLIPDIISQVDEPQRGLDFAIVLADESLLTQVLSGIPADVRSVNVTMGCPLASSPWGTLMKDILLLQLNMRDKGGKWHFYHRQTYDILSSGIIRGLLDDAQKEVVDKIYKDAKYYIPEEDFGEEGTLLRTVFAPVVTSRSKEPEDLRVQIETLAEYQLGVIRFIVAAMGENNGLLKEFAMQYYLCVNRLKGLSLAVQPRTWAHLIDRLAAGVSVPFEGEPLGGMQVMGPLETRALDFRHIVIMNANEGVFPRRSSSPSFIPPELRAAFDLPTYDRQDAVWAYYFYRLVTRAENIWMLYDSRTSGLTTGEESRFVKQLQYLYPDKCSLDFSVAQSLVRSESEEDFIPKTKEDIEVIENTVLSATAVENYMHCPVKFYYRTVRKLKPKNEVKETLDASLVGTVCHDTLQALYTSEQEMLSDKDFDKTDTQVSQEELHPYDISIDYLKEWYDREDDIRRKVNSLICRKLNCIDVTGANVIHAENAVKFVREVIKADINLLTERNRDHLTIFALEYPCSGTVSGHKFIGYIDRLDSVEDGVLRIVDYKSGGDSPEALENMTAEKVFGGSSYKYKAAFQFFIYDELAKKGASFPKAYKDWMLSNSMYAMKHVFTEKIKVIPVYEENLDSVRNGLTGLMEELIDPEVNFMRCSEFKCRYCDYKSLCGREESQS